MVLRMKKVVRRLALRPLALDGRTGPENEAEWHSMLSRMDEEDRAAEQRLARAEAALNKLTLS